MSRSFSKTFSCEFELQRYPLDIQICTMELKTDSDSGHDIQLNPKILEFIGSYSLGESKIKNYKIHQEKNKKNKITVLITFERQLIFMIMNAFLPTILINIVSIIFSFEKMLIWLFLLKNVLLFPDLYWK